mmetsp:Transcript_2921/g.6346  ORF Transcript_2921/g.6346 Transcript_2921/m.6346 type:complete len:230 (+) Transcript_2921:1840-2529(+)
MQHGRLAHLVQLAAGVQRGPTSVCPLLVARCTDWQTTGHRSGRLVLMEPTILVLLTSAKLAKVGRQVPTRQCAHHAQPAWFDTQRKTSVWYAAVKVETLPRRVANARVATTTTVRQWMIACSALVATPSLTRAHTPSMFLALFSALHARLDSTTKVTSMSVWIAKAKSTRTAQPARSALLASGAPPEQESVNRVWVSARHEGAPHDVRFAHLDNMTVETLMSVSDALVW